MLSNRGGLKLSKLYSWRPQIKSCLYPLGFSNSYKLNQSQFLLKDSSLNFSIIGHDNCLVLKQPEPTIRHNASTGALSKSQQDMPGSQKFLSRWLHNLFHLSKPNLLEISVTFSLGFLSWEEKEAWYQSQQAQAVSIKTNRRIAQNIAHSLFRRWKLLRVTVRPESSISSNKLSVIFYRNFYRDQVARSVQVEKARLFVVFDRPENYHLQHFIWGLELFGMASLILKLFPLSFLWTAPRRHSRTLDICYHRFQYLSSWKISHIGSSFWT